MAKILFLLTILLCVIQVFTAIPQQASEPKGRGYESIHRHPSPKRNAAPTVDIDDGEKTAGFWRKQAVDSVNQRLKKVDQKNKAKNVIFFLGDGMSVPTLAATRNYLGGENRELSFDKFPHTAVSKTYCVDFQVPDSACTATAYLTGVKANLGTLGITACIPYGDCVAMTNESEWVYSLAHLFQKKGLSSGFVTTTRVTHATPGGIYAHTGAREWEADTDIIENHGDPNVCTDVARQLINWDTGKNLKVIMGGGRAAMLPWGTMDEEGNEGYRSDGINLIEKWQDDKKQEGKKAQYVWNRKQLLNVDSETEYLMGLFEADHCNYNLQRDQELDPSLPEMTEAAIKILSKDTKGFFLFVEGGRIDTAHHTSNAHLALDETKEFATAVEIAVNMTSEEDTLIVVTSDHAHTMSFSGYPLRGTDIFGLVGDIADDGLPFTTLNYANGLGYRKPEADGSRHDPSKDDLNDITYAYAGIFPLESETHGGDDVIIFAKGPWSHLFTGVMEENVIPHIIAYAACVGDDPTSCDSNDSKGSSSTSIHPHALIVTVFLYSLLRLID